MPRMPPPKRSWPSKVCPSENRSSSKAWQAEGSSNPAFIRPRNVSILTQEQHVFQVVQTDVPLFINTLIDEGNEQN